MERNLTKSILISLLFLAVIIYPIFYYSHNTKSSLNKNLIMELKLINNEKILFGHRSVGDNIIQGMQDIVSQNDSDKIYLYRLQDLPAGQEYYFVHSYIGENGNPISKIDNFSKLINQLGPQKLSIAFMKLCFVDIKANTQINNIINYYVRTVDSLLIKYPNLIIIHCTVPLTSKPTLIMQIKDFIKGRTSSNLLDNIKRNEYNRLLLSKYSPDQIFDIAKIESTHEDGRREKIIQEGMPYYFLINDYTNDGGHLNKKGQYLVASNLISFITNKIKQNRIK